MSATERVTRNMLDNALPYQVALSVSDGEGANGTLLRLYCANLNVGPGHETAIVHDIKRYIFCFANLRDANSFRSQFGGKLFVASSLGVAGFDLLPQNVPADSRHTPLTAQTCVCL